MINHLRGQGLPEPDVHLTGIFRIDLDGDGRDEVLISASRLVTGGQTPRVAAGDYALVILRQVVDEQVITHPLALDVYPAAVDWAYPARYAILALLDLNGDGRLEVVVEAERYEDRLISVYQINDQGLQTVLRAGCNL